MPSSFTLLASEVPVVEAGFRTQKKVELDYRVSRSKSVSATRNEIHASSVSSILPRRIALARDARHLASSSGNALPDIDVRHPIPQRHALGCEHHEIIAKDAVAYSNVGGRIVFCLEGRDAPAFDSCNVYRHEFGPSESAPYSGCDEGARLNSIDIITVDTPSAQASHLQAAVLKRDSVERCSHRR
jgi:hypothetical protein